MKIDLRKMKKRTLIFLMLSLVGVSILFIVPGIFDKARKNPYDEPGVIISEIHICGFLTHFLEPTVTLSAAIVQPLIDNGGLRPGIVLCHGWGATKEELIYIAADFARAGMVVILFDMEGTGRSTGAHNLVGGRTRLNAWAAVEYLVKLSDILRINTSCIGMAGHSQGGITTAIASALDEVDGPASKGIANISASVSIFSGGFIEDIFGVMFGYDSTVMPILWPYLGIPLFDYNNPLDRWQQSVIPKINASRPKNWMLITGQSDELTNNWIQYHVMKHTVPDAITYEDLISNITTKNVWTLPTQLGNFSQGTARKFSLLYGRDHFGERDSVLTGTMMIDWFYDAFLFNQDRTEIEILTGIILFRDEFSDFNTDSLFDTIFKTISSNGLLIGLTIAMIPLGYFLSLKFKNKKNLDPVNARNIEERSFIKSLLLYAGIYLIASFCSFFFAWLFSIRTIVPFFVTNIFTVFFLMKQIILVPSMIGIIYYERKKFNQTTEDFGISRESFLKSALIGIIMIITFISITNIVDLTFNNFTHALFIPPAHLIGFITFILILGLNFFMDDLIFRGLVQSKMERYGDRWNAAFKTNLYTALIGGFAMMLTFIPLFWHDLGSSLTFWDSDMLRLLFRDTSLVLPFILAVFLGGAGYYALIGIISGIFRAKTRNIIAGTFVITLIASFLLVNWGPFGMLTVWDGVLFPQYIHSLIS
ncbi:MAG: alpha/beta fold hydrolase [Candidatus Helarchaeota archaeon]|nr:alpha/beta fold hydrolase [Candidatus Helarchaeota archaeon]